MHMTSCKLPNSPKKVNPEDIFDIIHQIREDSGETMYKALDERDGDFCTIKIVQPRDDEHLYQNNWKFKMKYIQAFYKCPNLINYKGAYMKDDNLWIIMDYCFASILEITEATGAYVKECHIRTILLQTLQALKYLHSKDITHKYIKASNIMLYNNYNNNSVSERCRTNSLICGYVRRQSVKYKLCVPTELIDVFITYYSVSVRVKLTYGEHMEWNPPTQQDAQRNICRIGVPYWMSPEMIINDKYTAKSDIWSLGITAIELATGKPPLADKRPLYALISIPKLESPTLPLKNVLDEYENWSFEFRDFVNLCLIKDPNKRASAEELLEHKWFKNVNGLADGFSEWVNNAMPVIHEKRMKKMHQELYEYDNSDLDFDVYGSDDDDAYGTMIMADGNGEYGGYGDYGDYEDNMQPTDDEEDDAYGGYGDYGTMIMIPTENNDDEDGKQ